MAFNRTFAQRLFNISKTWNPTLTNCRISTSSVAVQALIPPDPSRVAPDPGDDSIHCRFLQSRPIYQLAAAAAPELRSFPRGEKLLEKLRDMDIGKSRVRLEGLIRPPREAAATEGKLTVEDARKLLRISQLETVKSNLRRIGKDNIPLDEFVQICSESSGNREQGLGFAKTLDESGIVIVLGNVVFLRPDQVVKVIQKLLPSPERLQQSNNPRWKELQEMEKQKAEIDKRADSLVRRELWCGLGFLVIQTAAFMRLTFWELTWDVMEPICFYVTSMYFMAGYAFFLRTSKEPSFEGFFQSRFSTKQKQLMQTHDFDVARYNELKRDFYPHSSSALGNASSFIPSFDNSDQRTESGALN